jgi:hypothetical protein
MKRWMLFVLVGIASITIAFFALHQYLTIFTVPPVPRSGLMRTPDSAFKYRLCTEAYAFAHASPDNPYKTDFTFRDPFRKDNDTIVPHLLDYDARTQTVTFTVDIVISGVATFHSTIALVHELDGLSILLPDLHGHLQYSSVPQIIISSVGTGHIVVLDYTCSDQWAWKLTH